MSKAWNATKSEAIYEFREEEESPKNSETRRTVAGARDHLLSFAVFWIRLCERGQCRYSWEWIMWPSTATSPAFHVTNKLQV